MSKVEELEQIIEKLSPDDFERLSARVLRRQAVLGGNTAAALGPLRDHGAFLNGYSPEDEGPYDDAEGR